MAKGKRRKSVRNKKKPEPDNVSEENNEGSSVEVDSQEDPLLVSIPHALRPYLVFDDDGNVIAMKDSEEHLANDLVQAGEGDDLDSNLNNAPTKLEVKRGNVKFRFVFGTNTKTLDSRKKILEAAKALRIEGFKIEKRSVNAIHAYTLQYAHDLARLFKAYRPTQEKTAEIIMTLLGDSAIDMVDSTTKPKKALKRTIAFLVETDYIERKRTAILQWNFDESRTTAFEFAKKLRDQRSLFQYPSRKKLKKQLITTLAQSPWAGRNAEIMRKLRMMKASEITKKPLEIVFANEIHLDGGGRKRSDRKGKNKSEGKKEDVNPKNQEKALKKRKGKLLRNKEYCRTCVHQRMGKVPEAELKHDYRQCEHYIKWKTEQRNNDGGIKSNRIIYHYDSNAVREKEENLVGKPISESRSGPMGNPHLMIMSPLFNNEIRALWDGGSSTMNVIGKNHLDNLMDSDPTIKESGDFIEFTNGATEKILGTIELPLCWGSKTHSVEFAVIEQQTSPPILSDNYFATRGLLTEIGDIRPDGIIGNEKVYFDDVSTAWRFSTIDEEQVSRLASFHPSEIEKEDRTREGEALEEHFDASIRDIPYEKEAMETKSKIRQFVRQYYGRKKLTKRQNGALKELLAIVDTFKATHEVLQEEPPAHLREDRQELAFKFEIDKEFISRPRVEKNKRYVNEGLRIENIWKERGFISYVGDSHDPESIEENEIRGILNLTYAEQPSKIRVCLQSFAINPRDTIFDKNKTIRMKTVEDIKRSINPEWRVFALIDWLKAFFQMPVDEQSKRNFAFRTPSGRLATFNTCPYGLSGIPAAFQKFTDRLLGEEIRRHGWLTYVDDNLTGAKTLEELIPKMRVFADRCHEKRLLVSLKKIQIGTTLKVLGQILTPDGWRKDPEKVETLNRFPDLTKLNVKEAYDHFMSAVGMLRHLMDFIEGLGEDLAPFNKKTSRKRDWSWSKEDQQQFEKILAKVQKDIVLAKPDFSKPLAIKTDASNNGFGGYIFYEGDDGKEKIIGYFSKAFTSAQKNYPTVEQEMLAVVYAIGHYEDILSHAESFKIYTDQRSIVYLAKMFRERTVSKRMFSWICSLLNRKFTIHHVPGKLNIIADALSRSFLGVNEDDISRRFALIGATYLKHHDKSMFDGHAKTPAVLLAAIESKSWGGVIFPNKRLSSFDPFPYRYYSKDAFESDWEKEIETLGERVNESYIYVNGPFARNQEITNKVRTTNIDAVVLAPRTFAAPGFEECEIPHLVRFAGYAKPLPSELKLLVWRKDKTNPIPKLQLRENLLEESVDNLTWRTLHQRAWTSPEYPDAFELIAKGLIQNGEIPEDVSSEEWKSQVDQATRAKDSLRISEGMLFYEDRKYVNLYDRFRIIYEHHDEKHRGIKTTTQEVEKNFWWPEMKKDIAFAVRNCYICNVSKPRETIKVPDGEWPTVGMFEATHIDLCGPFEFGLEKEYVMTAVDRTTGYTMYSAVKSKEPTECLETFIRDWVQSPCGVPRIIVSDNGSEFINDTWKAFTSQYGIIHDTVAADNSQGNAFAERANRTLQETLLMQLMQNRKPVAEWKDELSNVQFIVNSTRRSSGFSPYMLAFGRNPTTKADMLSRNSDSYRNFSDWWYQRQSIHASMSRIEGRNPGIIQPITPEYVTKGDILMLRVRKRGKLEPRLKGPYIVSDVKNNRRVTAYHYDDQSQVVERDIKDFVRKTISSNHVPKNDAWEVESILDRKKDGRRFLYLVKWRNWDESFNTWLSRRDLSGSRTLLKEYEDSLKKKKN